MEYRALGNTDLTISTLAFGCWAIADDTNWGDQDEADSQAGDGHH